MAFSAPQGLVLAENEGSMASLEEILMTEHLFCVASGKLEPSMGAKIGRNLCSSLRKDARPWRLVFSAFSG